MVLLAGMVASKESRAVDIGKGSKYRPRSTTREEQDLRYRYATTKMTFNQFEIEWDKLKKQGLIKRDGRVIN